MTLSHKLLNDEKLLSFFLNELSKHNFLSEICLLILTLNKRYILIVVLNGLKKKNIIILLKLSSDILKIY